MEIEIKLNVKPAIEGGPAMLFTKLTMQPAIGGYPLGDIFKSEIRDLYYDTEDGALANAGAGLRSRLLEGRPYVTLKIEQFRDGALFRREEFEEPLTPERFDWVLAQAKELIGEGPFSWEDFAAGRPCGNLVPTLEVGTARFTRPIANVAKLVLDMVDYPGISTHPFFDIEVEANTGKSGERVVRAIETELYALAKGDLAPAKMNKLQRGLKLKDKAKSN
jgi:hypothetical protein